MYLDLDEARKRAESFMLEIGRYCKRIEIAGSVRRQKPAGIKDIEIVMIPESGMALGLQKALKSYGAKFPSKQTKFYYGGAKVDLFITTPECWGCIFLIRTGDKHFSKAIVTYARRKEFRFERGRLWNDEGLPLNTPEETDVFKALKIPFISPEKRLGARAISMAIAAVKEKDK